MADPHETGNDALPEVGARTLMPPPRDRGTPLRRWLLLAVAVLGIAAGGWWYQRSRVPAPEAQTQPGPLAEPAAAASAPPAQAAAPAAPLPEPKLSDAPLDAAEVATALAALVGRPAAQAQLITDDFVRRFVVTVDNLGREHAASRLWPARPTPGRFQVIERGGRLYVSPDNGARYTPWVLLAERVDPRAAVALYGRMLPLLQKSYEELGYPGQRFHQRLITVIDHLLAAPQAAESIELTLTEVKGEVPSEQPWVRYEFADPALESASAGQKIMMRVGAVNERRLKHQLRALRAELVRQAQP